MVNFDPEAPIDSSPEDLRNLVDWDWQADQIANELWWFLVDPSAFQQAGETTPLDEPVLEDYVESEDNPLLDYWKEHYQGSLKELGLKLARNFNFPLSENNHLFPPIKTMVDDVAWAMFYSRMEAKTEELIQLPETQPGESASRIASIYKKVAEERKKLLRRWRNCFEHGVIEYLFISKTRDETCEALVELASLEDGDYFRERTSKKADDFRFCLTQPGFAKVEEMAGTIKNSQLNFMDLGHSLLMQEEGGSGVYFNPKWVSTLFFLSGFKENFSGRTSRAYDGGMVLYCFLEGTKWNEETGEYLPYWVVEPRHCQSNLMEAVRAQFLDALDKLFNCNVESFYTSPLVDNGRYLSEATMGALRRAWGEQLQIKSAHVQNAAQRFKEFADSVQTAADETTNAVHWEPKAIAAQSEVAEDE